MPVPEFRDPDDPIGDLATVGEFWRWAMSDLLGNRARGILAEFIVGKLLGDETLSHPRLEWDSYDLFYREHKIEVKSLAYVQTWHTGGVNERSALSFGIAPHTGWDARTNTYEDEKKRYADCYVFCVFPAERGDPTHDVLDLDKWAFYITTTAHLETRMLNQIGELSASHRSAQYVASL